MVDKSDERRGPPDFSIRAVSRVEALKHLDPAGALTGLNLDDTEGMAIRAALDLIGQLRDPPVAGNAAIRAALKDYPIGLGYWPANLPSAFVSSTDSQEGTAASAPDGARSSRRDQI